MQMIITEHFSPVFMQKNCYNIYVPDILYIQLFIN